MMIKGIGRVADNEKAIILYFDRRLTDDEMRALHDHLREIDLDVPDVLGGMA
jgi:hypothetical protein